MYDLFKQKSTRILKKCQILNSDKIISNVLQNIKGQYDLE